jgi:hypothetical protein
MDGEKEEEEEKEKISKRSEVSSIPRISSSWDILLTGMGKSARALSRRQVGSLGFSSLSRVQRSSNAFSGINRLKCARP